MTRGAGTRAAGVLWPASAFVDVAVRRPGTSLSAVPLAEGWERGDRQQLLPKGLVEDVNELRLIKAEMERTYMAFPNLAGGG